MADPAATIRRSARLNPAEPDPRAARGSTGPLAPLRGGDRIDKPTTHMEVKTIKLPKPDKRECTVCGRELGSSAFSKSAPTAECTHGRDTCRACIQEWIRSQLNMTAYDRLTCPQCPAILSNANVKRLAAPRDYRRFDELERRDIANKTPGWRWCLSPVCRAGQIHVPSERRKRRSENARTLRDIVKPSDIVCQCNECGAKACVQCDCPFHDGESCEEYQTRRSAQFEHEEQATQQIIASTCKQCPTCQKTIEKNGGCDQMRCSQCRTSFCWLCEKTYTHIRANGHDTGCVYALPGRWDPHAPNAPRTPRPDAAVGRANDRAPAVANALPPEAPPRPRRGAAAQLALGPPDLGRDDHMQRIIAALHRLRGPRPEVQVPDAAAARANDLNPPAAEPLRPDAAVRHRHRVAAGRAIYLARHHRNLERRVQQGLRAIQRAGDDPAQIQEPERMDFDWEAPRP